jgi:Arc/MetJ-type ribon-helix-helix transcriptional regulator
MVQAKFSITDEQREFLDEFEALGYPDRSSVVRAAVDRFRKQLEEERLRASADLYAEVYAEDRDLQELTDRAIREWPE